MVIQIFDRLLIAKIGEGSKLHLKFVARFVISTTFLRTTIFVSPARRTKSRATGGGRCGAPTSSCPNIESPHRCSSAALSDASRAQIGLKTRALFSKRLYMLRAREPHLCASRAHFEIWLRKLVTYPSWVETV